jgi:hypothetical protein
MTIEYRKWITRAMLRAEPDKLFVFGDNMQRYGLGGQAKEMRGEPNAVGIPTKHAPHMGAGAFFHSNDFDRWYVASHPDFVRIENHVINGGVVVWPEDGIGTGRARLAQGAPNILNKIKSFEGMIT